MVMLRKILLFLCYLMTNNVNAQGGVNDNCCPKPELEIGFGPQWSIPVILDSEVGSFGTNPGKESRLNYTFYATIRTHPSTVQAGMELIHDRKQFNIYLPLLWPSQETSQWEHIYTAYRIGIGAHARLNANRYFIQAGAANMFTLSQDTEIYYEEPGVGKTIVDEEYSSKNGWFIQLKLGYKWHSSERLTTSLGYGIDTSEYQYESNESQRYWKVRTNMLNLTLNYRLNNPESQQ